jgi:putative hemolysin
MKVPEELSYASKEDPTLKRAVIKLLERVSGKKRLERVYARIEESLAGRPEFWDAALEGLGIRAVLDGPGLGEIPAEGPLVLVANHPFGILDGMIMCRMASRLRTNWKVLINSDLSRIDHLHDFFLPVDFRPTAEATRTNIATKQRAVETLRAGGAVIIFPSGGIATAPRVLGRARELEWKLFVMKMLRLRGARVVPVYFHGQNSVLFHAASRVSMTLRLSLVIRELTRRMGGIVRATVGVPHSLDDLEGETPAQLLESLQERVMALSSWQDEDALLLPQGEEVATVSVTAGRFM